MDYAQFLNDIKTRSDSEVQFMATQYGIEFSKKEIRALRPLLEDISFHWLFTGVPDSFLMKVEAAIGKEKSQKLFQQYLDSI